MAIYTKPKNFNWASKALLFIAVFALTAVLMLNIQTTGFAPLSGAGSGLVAQYTFDEGSGTTAADSSGSGNNATLSGGPIWTAGKAGSALSFDGSDDFVNTGQNLIGAYPASACAWINPQANGVLGSIITNTAFELMVYYDGASYALTLYNNNGSLSTNWGTISPNTWQHVCAVIESGNTARIYINGAESKNGNIGNLIISNTVGIGRKLSGGYPYKGAIDEVRIYSRALTPAEVLELFNGVPVVPDTQAPSTPTGLNATATAQNQIDISWNDSTDNIAVTGYKIYRNGTQVGTSTSTTYSDSGLTANTTYNYKVAANDAAGNTSAQSTQASATTFAPDTQAPSTPTGLNATAVSSSQINLSWNPSSDNVIVTGYKIYRGGTQIGTSTTTTYSDTALAANTAYNYRVAANDAAGNTSTQSGSAGATTLTQSSQACTSFTYSTWGTCTSGTQTRTVLTSSPSGCTGGNPVTTQTCTGTSTTLIPAERLVDWTPGTMVGVPGGIPTNRTKCATTQCSALENAAAGYKNGTTNAAPLIQAAIDSASANTYVFIPAGTWLISSALYLNAGRSSVTLRGAGLGATTLDCRPSVCINAGSQSDYQLAWPTS